VDEIDNLLIDHGLHINSGWRVFGLTATKKDWYLTRERHFMTNDRGFTFTNGCPGELN